MASYFDEHNCTSNTSTANTVQPTFDLLQLIRLMIREDIDLEAMLENNGGKRVAPPASKEAIRKLERRQITDDENESNCPVCLVNYEVNEEVVIMPCNHSYHDSCLLPWLEKTNSCAVCRFELPTDDRDYEEHKQKQLEEKQREERAKDFHNSMFG